MALIILPVPLYRHIKSLRGQQHIQLTRTKKHQGVLYGKDVGFPLFRHHITSLCFPLKWKSQITFVMLILPIADVYLCCACVTAGTCCSIFCTHVQSERRALWILISHFVICRYLGGEVCAWECGASDCLDLPRGSAGDLHFSISEDNSGTWLHRIWLSEPSLDEFGRLQRGQFCLLNVTFCCRFYPGAINFLQQENFISILTKILLLLSDKQGHFFMNVEPQCKST